MVRPGPGPDRLGGLFQKPPGAGGGLYLLRPTTKVVKIRYPNS